MVVSRTNRLAYVLAHRQRESAFYDVQDRKKYTFQNRGLALQKYAGRSDVFGSFTELPEPISDDPNASETNPQVKYKTEIGPKLGINPSTVYNTPIGVYCYPIGYMASLYDKSSAEFTVPFASKSKYIHIFSVKGLDRALMFNAGNNKMVLEVADFEKTYHVSDTQKAEIYKVLQRAKIYVANNASKELSSVDPIVARNWYERFIVGLKSPEGAGVGQFPPTFQKAIMKYFTFSKLRDYNEPFKSPYGKKDKINGFDPTYAFSQILSDISLNQAIENTLFPYEDRLRNLPGVKVLSEEEYQECKRNTFKDEQRVECDTAFVWNFLRLFVNNKVKWTVMLRQMGFIGAIDEGTGTIHENEPIQAVFFNPSSIKVIEVMHNKTPKQWHGHDTGTQSLLSQWAENPGERIESALAFLDSEIDTLKESRERAIIRGYNTKVFNNIQVGLTNILKYIGWLNMHLNNHPKWSPDRRKQVESEIERSIYGPALNYKQVKDLYERVIKSLRVRNR